VVCPLTPLDTFVATPLATPQSGPTHLGEALMLLARRAPSEIVRSTPERKGDWAPLLFVMTDGKPSDTQVFEEGVVAVRRVGFANMVGCAAGPKAEKAALERFCDHVVALDALDSAGFAQFFKWVSEAIATGSRSQGVGGPAPELPPPPEEIRIVI
jgi:uncharacterized protein YegL